MTRTARDRRADRYVDLAHTAALKRPDPVAFMRDQQAQAERRYFVSGGRDDLAVVRAFERSLDREAD